MSNNNTFKQGSTFSFALNVPDTICEGYFRDWEVQAHIRRKGDSTRSGLISSLGSRWEDISTTMRLYVFDSNTKHWPLGPAEMDILLISANGYKLPCATIEFDIQRGISNWNGVTTNTFFEIPDLQNSLNPLGELELQLFGVVIAGKDGINGKDGKDGATGPQGLPGIGTATVFRSTSLPDSSMGQDGDIWFVLA